MSDCKICYADTHMESFHQRASLFKRHYGKLERIHHESP